MLHLRFLKKKKRTSKPKTNRREIRTRAEINERQTKKAYKSTKQKDGSLKK
jgi:hypothetical protein